MLYNQSSSGSTRGNLQDVGSLGIDPGVSQKGASVQASLAVTGVEQISACWVKSMSYV